MIKKLLFLLILPFLLLFSGCDEAWELMIDLNLVDDGGSDHSDPTDDYTNYTLAGGYPDLDLDGIPDAAEMPNTKFEDMPLYDWGARPAQRDLFIHVATMEMDVVEGKTDGGLLLQKDALDKIVAAFAAQNIALHFDVGRHGLYEGYTESDSETYNLSDRDNQVPYASSIHLSSSYGHDASVSEYKSLYFPSERDNIFYFLVAGSSQNLDGSGGSSGVAWLRGQEFLMTLGDWGINYNSTEMINVGINFQAATIMHEFGHILGLRHGGDEDQNYKPNYYSIMNYMYQLSGLPEIGNVEGDRYYYERCSLDSTGGVWKTNYSDYNHFYNLNNSPYSTGFSMNYSFGNGGDLNENDLNENDGLRQSSSGSVDWDGNTTIGSSVSEDLNIMDEYDNAGSTKLSDYNDWANLYYYYYNVNSLGVSRTALDTLEIMEEEKPRFIPLLEAP